ILGFAVLTAMNIAAVPLINVVLVRFLRTHPRLPHVSRWILLNYWAFTAPVIGVFLVAIPVSLVCMHRRLAALFPTEKSTKKDGRVKS
ncbi:MAG: hypothetical protein ABI837_17895, partial [Acidobacteriota bacterium]